MTEARNPKPDARFASESWHPQVSAHSVLAAAVRSLPGARICPASAAGLLANRSTLASHVSYAPTPNESRNHPPPRHAGSSDPAARFSLSRSVLGWRSAPQCCAWQSVRRPLRHRQPSRACGVQVAHVSLLLPSPCSESWSQAKSARRPALLLSINKHSACFHLSYSALQCPVNA